jgi:hypothetical protein
MPRRPRAGRRIAHGVTHVLVPTSTLTLVITVPEDALPTGMPLCKT